MSGERPDSMAKLIVGEAAEAEYAAAVEWYAARSLAAADGFIVSEPRASVRSRSDIRLIAARQPTGAG